MLIIAELARIRMIGTGKSSIKVFRIGESSVGLDLTEYGWVRLHSAE